MTSVADSAEKLAEIKAEDAKNPTEAAAAVAPSAPAAETTDAGAGPSGEGASKPDKGEDVSMSDADNKDKALRAVRQIEFYFADSNLPYDKFMWTLHTANPEHWVPISTVASFKRMREYAAPGTAWLVNALRTISDSLEIDEAGEKVRRRTEVTEPKGQFDRSIYAKGFGEETPGMQQKLEAYFNEYGRTSAVRMRRIDDTKLFKGSVFVEFDDMTSVEKFLNADPKPVWEGTELLTMSKEAYCEMKIKEKGLTGKAADIRRQTMAGTGRKGFNAFKEMSGNDKGKKKNAGKDGAKRQVVLEFLGQKIPVHEEDGGSIKEEDFAFVKGASLRFDGVEGDVAFDEIKGPLKERFARAPFVQYNKGDTWGLVGFDKALSEDEVTYVKEHIKTLGSKDVAWSVPDEEAEKAFQLQRAASAAKRALHFATRDDRGGSGRGRGGRGGGRGGRGRGGRGGRGGNRGGDRDRPAKDSAEKPAAGEGEKPEGEQAGDKRKRAVEPDGGPDEGVRGRGVPAIQSAKKAKTDGDAPAAASSSS